MTPDVFRELETEIIRKRGTIVVPTYAGRRGHPVWLAWLHVEALCRIPADQGLNSYIRSRAADVAEVPWSTSEILLDLDTPEDYERLASRNDRPPLFIATTGEQHYAPPYRPQALLPGSFNPLHEGHLGLAATARGILVLKFPSK